MITTIRTTLLSSFCFLSFACVADEKLSISGYLDLSAKVTETDGESSEQKLSLDTLELRFDYQLSDDLYLSSHVRGGSDEDMMLEQANLNYSFSDNFKIHAGKFLSIQGFEAYHSPDLFQYSHSATLVYPGMMNGVAMSYQQQDWFFYTAVLASAWDSKDTDAKDKAFEVATQYKPGNGLTLHLGYTAEDHADGRQQSLINTWSSYQYEQWMMAAEFNTLSDWQDYNDSGHGWLVMTNYSFNPQWSLTLRTSALSIETETNLKTEDRSEWTLSPTYKINDFFSLIFEVNRVTDHLTSKKANTLAMESIVLF